MANIYLRKELYEELVRRGEDPPQWVNELVAKTLDIMQLKEEEKNL